MTDEYKEILLQKMIDDPSSLSDEDLAMISDDAELREFLKISSAVSGACMSRREIDMDREWTAFRSRLRPRVSPKRRFLWIAAAFIGIALLTGMVVRLTQPVPPAEHSELARTIPHYSDKPARTPDVQQQDTAFAEADNQQSESPVESPLTYQHTTSRPVAAIQTDVLNAAENEGDLEEEMDLDEYLRIEQARIENDMARQVAVVYQDEYEGLLPVIGALEESDPALEKYSLMVRKVTLQ